MIFVPPSQHGDGERSAGPILIALLFVAVFAGAAVYRKYGGEFSIEGFHAGAAMWIVAGLAISLAAVVGMVAVQRRVSRAARPSIDDRLTGIEDQIAQLRESMTAEFDAVTKRLDGAGQATDGRGERRV